MRRADSDLGLSMEIPDDFQIARLGPALRVFAPQRERTRSPTNIVLTLVDRRPEFSQPKTKDLGQQRINYVVVEEPGGSGGEAVRLKAWVESNGRFVLLDSVVQPESGGDADFLVEWAILSTLRWNPGG